MVSKVMDESTSAMSGLLNEGHILRSRFFEVYQTITARSRKNRHPGRVELRKLLSK